MNAAQAEFYKKINARLDRLADVHRWTRKQLAEAIGLSQGALSMIKSGKRGLGRKAEWRLQKCEAEAGIQSPESVTPAEKPLGVSEPSPAPIQLNGPVMKLAELRDLDPESYDALSIVVDRTYESAQNRRSMRKKKIK